MPSEACVICLQPASGSMCALCCKSYDRWSKSAGNDGDTWSVIRWTAERTRRMERRRQRHLMGVPRSVPVRLVMAREEVS